MGGERCGQLNWKCTGRKVAMGLKGSQGREVTKGYFLCGIVKWEVTGGYD